MELPHVSGASPVEALNRFLGAMVRDTWDDLDRALEDHREDSRTFPESSPWPIRLSVPT